jgi:hypothetical protein
MVVVYGIGVSGLDLGMRVRACEVGAEIEGG